MTQKTAQYWIDHLNLQPHPEGGYYKEVFRSQKLVLRTDSIGFNSKKAAFNTDYDANKSAITSIYYLLEAGDFSAFHRLASDELWYFHNGEPLHIHVINLQGIHTILELSDSETGVLQAIIPPNTWFASEIASKTGYVLVSCAVAPGFEFTEFEMAKKGELITQHPQLQTILNKLCRS
jgi:predicted cupin superfamily sugar epimerase